MRVVEWGNALAMAVARALRIKGRDEIEVGPVVARTIALPNTSDASEVLAGLQKFRGRLPAGFRFDRIDANGR